MVRDWRIAIFSLYVCKSQEKIKIKIKFEFAMFIMLIFSDIFLNIISSRTGRLSLILKFKVKVNSPYDDNYTTTASTTLTQPSHHQNLLAPPPSRTNSRGRQTTFTEPGSLAAGARDQSNLLTGEGLFSLNSLIFPFYYITLSESANLTRGRQRTRTFFNTIKRKLSGTRSQSSSLQSQTANGNHYHLMCGEKW